MLVQHFGTGRVSPKEAGGGRPRPVRVRVRPVADWATVQVQDGPGFFLRRLTPGIGTVAESQWMGRGHLFGKGDGTPPRPEPGSLRSVQGLASPRPSPTLPAPQALYRGRW